MGSLANYAEDKLVDFAFRNQTFTQPTPYLCLLTAPASDSAAGTEVANSNAYARTAITFSAAGSITSRAIKNLLVTFPTPSGGDWGTITDWKITDSGTYGAGNTLAWGTFANSKVILNGQPAICSANDIVISCNAGKLTNALVHALLDHMFNVAPYTPPTNVFHSLHSATTGDDGTGAELSGNAYARQQITFGSASSGGSISNTADLVYPAATPSAWTDSVDGAIWTLVTGGVMMAHGILGTSPMPIGVDDIAKLLTGQITLSID